MCVATNQYGKINKTAEVIVGRNRVIGTTDTGSMEYDVTEGHDVHLDCYTSNAGLSTGYKVIFIFLNCFKFPLASFGIYFNYSILLLNDSCIYLYVITIKLNIPYLFIETFQSFQIIPKPCCVSLPT